MNQDSLVVIVIRLKNERPENRGSIPGGGRYFFLFDTASRSDGRTDGAKNEVLQRGKEKKKQCTYSNMKEG
jgi:hypothetical protein